MSAKRLITSALPYVNNVPHLGNIIGCVLSADVYARYCRSAGYETLYICATDEYGTATENKAREEGLTPQQICDKYHAVHKEVYKAFNISFDCFGRTSIPEHTEITQSIYLDLDEAGMIEEKESEQTYCEHDQMFLADRYVLGKCPFCGFEEARGDQCDNCGKLLQPEELVNPQCQICGRTPVMRSTKHLYLNLPKLEPRLREFHAVSIEKGKWAGNAVGATKSWLETGLLPRPITRDLSWGIAVPRPGYENKVFYVWFDAPIGYISVTKQAFPDSWEDWWLNPEKTELYQFMAKDNIPFHTVVFPACLLGSKRDWTMLHHINATEYLNYEKQKFSKSRKIGVFGTDVLETDIHIDLWRFYLLYNRPERSDSNFSWDTFIEDINSNFIDNIGNLLNRALVFLDKHFDGQLSETEFTAEQKAFLKQVKKEEAEIVDLLERVQLKDALKQTLSLGKKGNKFFQDQEPWVTVKKDPKSTLSTLMVLVYLIRDIGILLSPYMPETSERILEMVGGDADSDFKTLGDWQNLNRIRTSKPQILFQKLQQKKIMSFKEKFSGMRNLGKNAVEAWKEVALKVGKITSVERHPSADLLYVEQIDCGEGETRTIVSGLVKYYTPEQLLGKQVLIVSNLAAAKLRGVESQGMLLAAEQKGRLEVIEAAEASVGSEVLLEDETSHEDAPQITIDQLLEAKLTIEDHSLQIDGRKLYVEGRPIMTQNVDSGKVR